MDHENELSPAAALARAVGGSGSLITSDRGTSAEPKSAPDIKVPPRGDFALTAEPRRRGKPWRVISAVALLGFGWLLGFNTHSGSSAVESLQRGLLDHFEHLISGDVASAEHGQKTPPQKPHTAQAMESIAPTLSTKLDEVRASSERLARDLGGEVARLRGSMEQTQTDLASKLSRLGERVADLEQRTAVPSLATARPEQVSASLSAVPVAPPVQRSAPAVTPKVSPSPASAEVRREPPVLQQWKIREVLNGTALLEGPGGVIGVSRGQTVPGIGRVESIARQGSRWVVATSKGLIIGN